MSMEKKSKQNPIRKLIKTLCNCSGIEVPFDDEMALKQ